MQLSGNTVVITGGATGIGYAMAKYLNRRENTVIICGRRADRLAQAAKELPGIHTVEADVADPAGRDALTAFVSQNYSAINMLINNAGIQRDIDLTGGLAALDGPSEINVNLGAPIYLSAQFMSLMSGKDNATIVNVSSALAFMVDRASRAPLYCATKAGLHAFCIAQRIQLAPMGIRVVEIIPPAVESELNMESRIKRNFVTSPHMMSADDFVTKAFAQMEQDADEVRLQMNWKESK